MKCPTRARRFSVCVPRFDANPERLRVDSDALAGLRLMLQREYRHCVPARSIMHPNLHDHCLSG